MLRKGQRGEATESLDDNGRGEARQRKNRGDYQEGETSVSKNPMDGIGTKQGRADESGVTRQEVEKT
jgi:hypothetical protein